VEESLSWKMENGSSNMFSNYLDQENYNAGKFRGRVNGRRTSEGGRRGKHTSLACGLRVCPHHGQMSGKWSW
jgi:formamidopyrimidine-DNA glycosylase